MAVKVSVSCVTYNHERFIRQALEGFVMQKTDFDFEVLIYDDASTDNTQKIIKEYEEKYPHIIKAIYQTENQFSKGNIDTGLIYNAPRITGKYVALCDGDDYWTDENKLQKQVDFLDKNPEYSICFHRAKVIYQDSICKLDEIWPKETIYKNEITYQQMLEHNMITTASVMFRWIFDENNRIQDVFPRNILPIDWYLHLLHSKQGKVYMLNDVMSVYRINNSSLWHEWFDDFDKIFVKFAKEYSNFFWHYWHEQLNEDKTYRDTILMDTISSIYEANCDAGNYENCKYLEDKFPEIMDKVKRKSAERRRDLHLKHLKYLKLWRIMIFVAGSFMLTSLILLFILIKTKFAI